MKVFVETTSGLGRRLTIEVPGDKIEQAVKERIGKLAKTAKLDGFRPGKVPAKVLQQRYGDSVRAEVLNEQIQETVADALIQEKLKCAGMPKIELKQFEANKPLIYEALFEVYPEIELAKFDGAITQYKAEISDADIEETIERLRKQHADWESVDRAAAKDDKVVIDFTGLIDDEPLENGEGKEVPLILGSGSMIPGFEDGIIGMKAKEERDIKVTFPKDYHHKASAGKKAVFKIKVLEVSEAKLPELNDEFAEKCGIEEGGMAKLRENITQKLKDDLELALEAKNKKVVLDKLLELNKIEIPQTLVDGEIDVLYNQFMQQFPPNMPKDKMPEIDKNIFKDQAVQRVTLGLLMLEVVKLHDLEPDEKRVREIVETYAQSHEDPQKVVSWYMADKKRLEYFRQLSLEEQVVAKLLESAKVEEKQINLEEVMQQ